MGFFFFLTTQPIFRSITEPERTPTSACAHEKCDAASRGKLADCRRSTAHRDGGKGLSLTPAWRCHSINLRQRAVMRARWENYTSAEPLRYWRVLIYSSDYKHSDLFSNTPPDARHGAGSRHTSAPHALIVRFLANTTESVGRETNCSSDAEHRLGLRGERAAVWRRPVI